MNITPRFSFVDVGNISMLPTGSLKIEEGVLFQEMMVINHRPSQERPTVGISYEWEPLPKEFIDLIKTQ